MLIESRLLSMEFFFPLATVLLVTLVTAGVLYLRWVKKRGRYWKERGIAHEPSMNFISNTLSFLSKPMHEMLLEQYKKHGRIYGTFEFRKPVLTVCEPDLLKDILVKDFHIFNYRRDIDLGDSTANTMITVLKGEDWKRVRTIITPAFTSRKMRQMSHIINACSKNVIETLEKFCAAGEPADCKSVFGAFTMDVIASAAFGTKIDSLNDPDNIFVKNAKHSFSQPSFFQFASFFLLPACLKNKSRLPFISKIDFFKDVALNVIKERKETGKRYNDVLQLLMDARDELENETSKESLNSTVPEDEVDQYGSVVNTQISGMVPRLKYKKLYEDELVAQCFLFFIAGYETTASTLSFMAYSLALNPECQEKLIAEVDEVFSKHEEINYDVIRDMKYLDCVVSETMRMYPSLTRSERTASEDYELGNTGITIEKGTLVGFNIHAMHYDPEFFENPEKFDPERFKDENINHPQYAYLPFGAGPRNCLGMRFALMEIKICMSNVLRHYRFKKAETTKVPPDYKKGTGNLSVDSLPLIVERRSK